MGQRSVRRLSRILVWLVLLDKQHAVRADGDAVFRRRVGVRARPQSRGLADNKTFALIASLVLLSMLVILNVWAGRREVGQQSWRDRHVCCGISADGFGSGGLDEIWHDHPLGRFQDSGKSALRAEFIWRNLFWIGGPGTGLGYGGRDRESQESVAGGGGLGRIAFRVALHWRHTDVVDCGRQRQISVLQGIVQAVSHGRKSGRAVDCHAPFAFLLSVSIAGIGSAWLGGSARIPFVAGLDSYMPAWLGKVHPRYATPYAALIVHASVSMILVI